MEFFCTGLNLVLDIVVIVSGLLSVVTMVANWRWYDLGGSTVRDIVVLIRFFWCLELELALVPSGGGHDGHVLK
jgi:hypothetical protein